MMRRPFQCLGLVAAMALSGCQSLGMDGLFGEADAAPGENTLASLEPAVVDSVLRPAESVDLEEVIEGYEALLPLLEDPEAIVNARHRLADLRFLQAENRWVEQAVDDLDVAIGAYETLLAQYPDRATNDQLYYQLAKAQELKGNSAAYLQALDRLVAGHPDSEFWVEAQFRRGEVLFSADDFPGAQHAFEAVIGSDPDAAGRETFLTNAHYMRGWSQFKQGDYERALLSYTDVLDRVLPADQALSGIDEQYQTLTEDLFRVMGLSFSYLSGAESVADLFRQTGPRAYEILVYDRYSELLLEKEQYSDAIAVYEGYIAIHPFSQWAPRYHINVIDTLQRAGFTADIPERKADFIHSYGITSAYWTESDGQGLAYVEEQLEQLLPEMANRAYVRAQRLTSGETTNDAGGDQAQTADHYREAAYYYAEFVDTFPRHPRTPELLFLLGETYIELEQWARAIRAFERVAYDFADYERAAEAAYASILTYNTYAGTWDGETEQARAELLELQQQSRLRFVNIFPGDSRALDVLYLSTQYDFEQGAYRDVVRRAQRIIDWQPAPALELQVEARLLKAHSLYRLEGYPEAELAYQDVLATMPEADARRDDLMENLAASVYHQAETRLAAGDKAGAVEEFLRVGQVAPAAALRANAEYDAANALMELADWSRAIEVMGAFRARYPSHEMIDTLPAKMALAYRETGQWEQAGDEMHALVALADTDLEKRETLLIAAELYDRADSTAKAIASYRRYANDYPAPADAYLEAADRLAQLYEQTGEPENRRFWLRKQMDAVDADPSADDHMRYLAAQASAVFANDALEAYNAIALTLPLNETMAAKTQALERAVNAYQKAAGYGVAEFSTEAGYQIADIYARLGRDLMEAELPPGLSELEQAQYQLLLEEQAFPFEENAIDIHEQNASRSWDGLYDQWVQRSFQALAQLLPGRYHKPELTVEAVDELE